MNPYAETMAALRERRQRIADLREEMRRLQADVTAETVTDYDLAGPAGPTRLSALFGNKSDLIVIHNMGRSCAYCTLWADGFNGVYHHLADRAAFVVSSPDLVDVQRRFADERGWRFPMVSHAGTTFAADMGYARDGMAWPGVSAFRLSGGRIERVSDAELGPGDDFCSAWHLFDLFEHGADNWSPKFRYPAMSQAAA